jgi:RNA polymerase sigma-70 factor (ECF subfamily)
VHHRISLTDESDEELVRRCHDRDHKAFTVLVDRYKHKVHWLIRRMIGDTEVEDLTQEAFLRAYQALPYFKGRSTFRTWLYKIAHNLCVTELQRRGRRGEHLSLDEEGEERVSWLLHGASEDLEAKIERWDISRNVQALVDRLPGHYRTVLTLFYLQQAKYEEIAEIMAIPLGTVKTYIHRAKLRLRDMLLAQPEVAPSLREATGDEFSAGGGGVGGDGVGGGGVGGDGVGGGGVPGGRVGGVEGERGEREGGKKGGEGKEGESGEHTRGDSERGDWE